MKLILLFSLPSLAISLSSNCGFGPCEVPACCPSGRLTTDASGCCQVCAKGLNEACGGPWNIDGTCRDGLKCLRQCGCKTVGSTDCVFPFSFQGKVYRSCTKDHSENGQPWCATQVDDRGIVINGKWGDCKLGCPGSDSPCDDLQLFNQAGRCLGAREAQIIQRNSFLNVKIDDEITVSNDIKKCDGGHTEENMPCRCVENFTSSHPGEGCQSTIDGGQGWCFLENLSDPENPSRQCFPDAIWSKTFGRYWSAMACNPAFSAPPVPPLPPVPFSTSSGETSPPAPPSSGSRLVLPPSPPE